MKNRIELAKEMMQKVVSIETLYDQLKLRLINEVKDSYDCEDISSAEKTNDLIKSVIDSKNQFLTSLKPTKDLLESILPKQELDQASKKDKFAGYPDKQYFINALLEVLYNVTESHDHPKYALRGYLAKNLVVKRVFDSLSEEEQKALSNDPKWPSVAGDLANWACGHLRKPSNGLIELPEKTGPLSNMWILSERGVAIIEKKKAIENSVKEINSVGVSSMTSSGSVIDIISPTELMSVSDAAKRMDVSERNLRRFMTERNVLDRVVLGRDPKKNSNRNVMLLPISLVEDLTKEYQMQ